MRYNSDKISVFVVVCLAIGIRSIVSVNSYSGAATPPLFGDYEAQRHWQEITFNLPAKHWYLNTTDNDLLYWGLDYPPLTAYHSLALGVVANNVNSSYVALQSSRGLESDNHKTFMRLTVLAADVFVYIPAIVFAVVALTAEQPEAMLPSLILLLFYPGQTLVDNGHFQYNNISLGLFLISVACLLKCRHKTASIAFSLALNYKQMELYHALPIFVYLLKSSFSNKSLSRNIAKLLEVGIVTVVTFLLLWLPWISSIESLSAAVLRLFPLNRGVFEDKVANVWCSANAIYKFKENFQNNQMALICMAATLIAILPSNFHLFFNLKKQTFLLSLVNTSLAFFLLSFQVHEKSILLAALPICLLLNKIPFSVLCFLKISTFSMLPLLIKDNLQVPYFALMLSFTIVFQYLVKIVYSKDDKVQRYLNICQQLLDLIILAASIATIFLPAPQRLPHLWSFLISLFCCFYFLIFLFETNALQFRNLLATSQVFILKKITYAIK